MASLYLASSDSQAGSTGSVSPFDCKAGERLGRERADKGGTGSSGFPVSFRVRFTQSRRSSRVFSSTFTAHTLLTGGSEGDGDLDDEALLGEGEVVEDAEGAECGLRVLELAEAKGLELAVGALDPLPAHHRPQLLQRPLPSAPQGQARHCEWASVQCGQLYWLRDWRMDRLSEIGRARETIATPRIPKLSPHLHNLEWKCDHFTLPGEC